MNTFYSNNISIYGEKGKVWLDALPEFVAAWITFTEKLLVNCQQ